jgi:hypothetical protein
MTESEWISTEGAIPGDGQRCWINTKKWGVMIATFYWKDSFERENMFINTSGGYISIDEVTHFQWLETPNPPKI